MKWVLIKDSKVANVIVPPSMEDGLYLDYLDKNFDEVVEVPDELRVEITYGYVDGEFITPLENPEE